MAVLPPPDTILRLLYDHIDRSSDLQARVKWTPNTVVLWDNRNTAHVSLIGPCGMLVPCLMPGNLFSLGFLILYSRRLWIMVTPRNADMGLVLLPKRKGLSLLGRGLTSRHDPREAKRANINLGVM